jgi:dTDP-4-amino-4,6-dideoxygalactose transaminase
MLAAFLFAQIEQRERVQARRRAIWEGYDAGLRAWAAEHGVQQPCVPADREQAYHMYYLLLPDLNRRQALIAHLRQHGIQAVFHYVPLHLSDMGRRLGGAPGQCPVTEDVSDRLVRLPLFFDLTDADQRIVIEAVASFRP